MEVLSHVNNLQDYARSLKDTRLASLKPPAEFFNIRQVSRPKDTQEYMKRASYNMCVVLILSSQRMVTDSQPLLFSQLRDRRRSPCRLLAPHQLLAPDLSRFPDRRLPGHL